MFEHRILKRRIIRIYPPYLLGLLWAILIFLVIQAIVPQWLDFNNQTITARLLKNDVDFIEPLTILGNLFYMPSGFLIVPFWSLTQEIIFYFSILFFFLNIRVYLILSFFVYMSGWIFEGYNVSDRGPIINFFWHYNIFFAVGIFMYKYKSLFQKLSFLKLLASVILVALLFLGMVISKFYLGGYNKITEGLAVIFSILMIYMFGKYKISNSVLKWLGSHSYTLYITHFASLFLFKVLLNVLISYDGGYIFQKWVWPIGVLFALLCSYVLFFLAERPNIKYLSKTRTNNNIYEENLNNRGGRERRWKLGSSSNI